MCRAAVSTRDPRTPSVDSVGGALEDRAQGLVWSAVWLLGLRRTDAAVGALVSITRLVRLLSTCPPPAGGVFFEASCEGGALPCSSSDRKACGRRRARAGQRFASPSRLAPPLAARSRDPRGPLPSRPIPSAASFTCASTLALSSSPLHLFDGALLFNPLRHGDCPVVPAGRARPRALCRGRWRRSRRPCGCPSGSASSLLRRR